MSHRDKTPSDLLVEGIQIVVGMVVVFTLILWWVMS